MSARISKADVARLNILNAIRESIQHSSLEEANRAEEIFVFLDTVMEPNVQRFTLMRCRKSDI